MLIPIPFLDAVRLREGSASATVKMDHENDQFETKPIFDFVLDKQVSVHISLVRRTVRMQPNYM